MGLEQTYVYNDVSADIFYYHEEEGYIISYVYSSFDNSTFDNCIKKYAGLLPIKQYLPNMETKAHSYKGFSIRIPEHPEEYLRFHYGDDYLTPRKWDYKDNKNDNISSENITDDLGVLSKY